MKRTSVTRLKMIIYLSIIVLLTQAMGVYAQDVVTVPNLSGLNIPQAAAQLNRAGLRLGAQSAVPPTSAPNAAPGIISQSIAAGTQAPFGSTVDISLVSAANVRLVYDDNDLTLLNGTGAGLDLTQIQFGSSDGTRRFDAARWRGNIDSGDCTQIWSIVRNAPKDVAGCASTFWLTTNDAGQHFWTQAAGVAEFNVIQGGSVLATCAAAPPNSQDVPTTCEFYILAANDGGAALPYIYFAYTEDRIAVINPSDDAWLPLDSTGVFNFNPQIMVPGAGLSLADPNLFTPHPVADMRRLAPGQCVMLTRAPLTNAEPPEACDVLSQLAIAPEVMFWSFAFELEPASRPGERVSCPGATAGVVTICVMPR
jgi:hypothetical protein